MKLKIFQIKSPHTDKIYIGGTTKKFISPLFECYSHDYNHYVKTNRVYRKFFDIFKAGDAYFSLLHECEVENTSEMWKKIREFKILHLENCINFKELIHVNTVRRYRYTPKRKKSQEVNEQEN